MGPDTGKVVGLPSRKGALSRPFAYDNLGKIHSIRAREDGFPNDVQIYFLKFPPDLPIKEREEKLVSAGVATCCLPSEMLGIARL